MVVHQVKRKRRLNLDWSTAADMSYCIRLFFLSCTSCIWGMRAPYSWLCTSVYPSIRLLLVNCYKVYYYITVSNVLQSMDRWSFMGCMWGLIKYVTWEYWFRVKTLVIVHVYLWLQAASYDCTNIVSIWLHCNDLIYSVHEEINWLHADYSQLMLCSNFSLQIILHVKYIYICRRKRVKISLKSITITSQELIESYGQGSM